MNASCYFKSFCAVLLMKCLESRMIADTFYPFIIMDLRSILLLTLWFVRDRFLVLIRVG